jgi:hypothetical protein
LTMGDVMLARREARNIVIGASVAIGHACLSQTPPRMKVATFVAIARERGLSRRLVKAVE